MSIAVPRIAGFPLYTPLAAHHFHIDQETIFAPCSECIMRAVDFTFHSPPNLLFHNRPVFLENCLTSGECGRGELLDRVAVYFRHARICVREATVLKHINTHEGLLHKRAEFCLALLQKNAVCSATFRRSRSTHSKAKPAIAAMAPTASSVCWKVQN